MSVWILDSFVFKFSTSLAAVVPLYVRIFAASLVFLFAIYLSRSGHRAISHEVQSQPRILCDGAFARVRHPLYLAALLFYQLLFFLTLSLICLGLAACIFLFYNFIASYEERWLEERFGQEYRDYRKRVPRWIPRLTPARF
jgi:protein-S-isoprenylcysteine O-methyltransferase Ste14